MHGLMNDIRYAGRSLLRSPGFSLITILTLALGVGATTALFTVVSAVLWRPLNFPDSESVVGVCQRRANDVGAWCGASPPNSYDWNRLSNTLRDFGIARTEPLQFRTDRGTEIVNSGIATPGFIRSLGFRPALGRLFDESDLPPNEYRVVVLTHRYWVTNFGADSSIVGQTIQYTGEPYEVIGVLAPDVSPIILDYAMLWRPLPWDPRDEVNRSWYGFYSVARLEPGVSLDEAQREMSTIAAGLEEAFPTANEDVTVEVVPLRTHLVAGVRGQLQIFLGASVLVLLIAAVNVANLLLARATDRQKEFAVRASLGAGKGRLIRQLLTESLALSTLGAIVGFLLGQAALRWFVALAPPGIPRLDEVALGPDVVIGSAFLLIVTVVAFGLAPAWRATRVDLSTTLKPGGRWRGSGEGLGARATLVVTEVALAVTLLAGAGLLLRSFATAARWDPGFDPDDVGLVWLLASTTRHAESIELTPLYDRILDATRAIPGVTDVGMASAGPLFGGEEHGTFTIAGRLEPSLDERPLLRWFDLAPGYFRTIGLPIVRGRDLQLSDVRGGPAVALINEAAARRFFAGEDPIGQHIVDREPFDGIETSMEIVGIVQDVRPDDPNGVPEPEIYWSNRQRTRWATYLIFRSAVPPDRLHDTIRERIAAVDPTMSVGRFTTMETLMGSRLVRPRFQMLLLGIFALVALTLATVGTYGVVSYGVTSRTNEFGLRLSLGAVTSDIVRMVLGQGARLAGLGIVIGLAGAFALTGFMRGMLVGVTPRDPITFVAVAILLGSIVLLASYVPARRAARIDPMDAMRAE